MRSVRVVGLVCGLSLCLLAVSAQGTPLNLSKQHYPLVYSGGIYVSYDPAGAGGGQYGLLTASGWPLELNSDETTTVNLWDGVFELEAVIDPSTGEGLSGTLTVTGDPDGYLEDLFYSTNLLGFGSSADDKFEFLFQQQGDMLAGDGDVVGVILWAWSIDEFLEPVFNIPFENNYNGEADTFYLPEPSSCALFAVIGLGLIRRRRSAR